MPSPPYESFTIIILTVSFSDPLCNLRRITVVTFSMKVAPLLGASHLSSQLGVPAALAILAAANFSCKATLRKRASISRLPKNGASVAFLASALLSPNAMLASMILLMQVACFGSNDNSFTAFP
jgi:hypothetical protein